MRLNKFIAQSTGISRRAADDEIRSGNVKVNGVIGELAQQITDADAVTLLGKRVELPDALQTILLNKPVGFVCSRDGQGSKTIYELLPPEFHQLKPVGRLDKNSSGLLLLTNDGQLAHELTHPRFEKTKVYKIALNKALNETDRTAILRGVPLDDGLSKLELKPLNETDRTNWQVTMSEGRNRQIRRTFEVLDYSVVKLHRTHFGSYSLGDLKIGAHTKA